MEVQVNKVYRHYKGDLYIVEGIGIDSETLEKVVVYRGLYGENPLWVRSYNSFIEEVNKNNQKYRFQLQLIESVNNTHENTNN